MWNRQVHIEIPLVGAAMAALRACNHAGVLLSRFRANNQKQLRQVSRQALDELIVTLGLGSLSSRQDSEAESVLFEYMNRMASAAIITATNHPQHSSVLSLYDTSAWLYDHSGKRRDSFTHTDHWLAWYPGLDNGDQSAREVINTMPAATEKEIPWIVKLLENPESVLRFRELSL